MKQFRLLSALLLAALPALADEPAVATPETEAPAEAAEMLAPPPAPPAVEAGLQVWFSRGQSEFEIEFGGIFLNGRSKLTWEDLDAAVLIFHAEGALSDRLRVGGRIGTGELDDGQNTDEDWLWDTKFSESTADTDGDVTLGDINLYYRLTEPGSKEFLQLDGFVGYSYYEDDLNDQNLVQVVPDEGPYPGLDSTFKFEWHAAKVGVRTLADLSSNITLKVTAAALYLIRYDGEGYWNLRDDFRRESPNFTQKSEDGMGVEGAIATVIRLTENLSLELGYWLYYIGSDEGEDVIYFADGTKGYTEITNVESFRHGVTVGLAAAF